MACYISSNDNRFYAALEPGYGTVAAITAANRFPGVRLGARQQWERITRRDKAGTRTFQGLGWQPRRRTTFELETYLVSRDMPGGAPGYGPLIQSAMGGYPGTFGGGAVQIGGGTMVTLSSAHGLGEGMAVSHGGEIRFVAAVPSAESVVLNAPFTTGVAAGSMLGATVSYGLAGRIPSVSLFDYWSPDSAVQRLLRGAAVDEMDFRVNGDFHEITFGGVAVDLLDNVSFENGAGGLSQFPLEPPLAAMNYDLVPGHMGQAWIGVGPSQFHTVTRARIRVKNNLETRIREFGSTLPRCVVPGDREVTAEFELFGQDNGNFDELYQAARQRSPISMMLQMGEMEGQLCGVYLKSFVPEVPEFVDDERRLRWRFSASRAQGTVDDELYVAFG